MSTGTSALLSPSAPPPAPTGRGRRWWFVVGLVAVVVLLVAATVLLTRGDGTDVVTPGGSATPTPSTAPEPSTAPPAPPPAVDRSIAVWPWAGSDTAYATPEEAARGFAVDFLGMAPTVVVGSFRSGDSRSGEVDVRPVASGPATTVLVRQLSGEDTWSVLGAATGQIELTSPVALSTVTSPVEVRGSALAFEGVVQVQVREDGQRAPIGTGTVTGGGDVPRPFTGSVAFDAPRAGHGALVLVAHSARDGSVWQATVVRVRLGSAGTAAAASCGGLTPAVPTPGAGQMVVTAYFTCDPKSTAEPAPFAVYRLAPSSPAVLRASLQALLAGPTADERAAGITSWFSGDTAGMLRGVSLTDGHAVVDLADLRTGVPGASTSAGSALLLSELDATVFQFGTVTSAEYRLEGSCTAFTEWLQVGGCTPRTR